MLLRRKKEKFQLRTEFENGKIIGLREGGFSYHTIGTRVQWNSSTVMRVWKQRTDEHRTTRKTGSGRRISLTANHRRLSLRWAHKRRAWQTDWHQVIFSDESRLNLLDHYGRIRVRRYAGERCLPECVVTGSRVFSLTCPFGSSGPN
ncbi:transposable element Tcb1 transposase [Trichonephila clavipes]|nr:transposable element Tcb1 transposase [Trichonephila clavipes]